MDDHKNAKVLVAVDGEDHCESLKNLLQQQGYTILTTTDGAEIVTLYRQHSPDIVLIDESMPNMDGYEVAHKIKLLAGEDLVPVLFLVTPDTAGSLLEHLGADGEDFILKPYDPSILLAKINVFVRMRAMHSTLQQQRDRIAELNDHMRQEQEVAKQVFDKVAHAGSLDAPNIKYRLSPITIFNGDVMLAGVEPSGNLIVLLGDFTGHGLNAAIGAMPLAQTFYSMLEKGFLVQSIAREINRKLHEILPVGVFCCAAIAELDFNNQLIHVWNGGLPDCLIYRSENNEMIPLKSRHLPLGIRSDKDFNDSVEIYNAELGDRLYFWSDGILESQNADGDLFGEEGLLEVFRANRKPETLFDEINQAIANFVGERLFDDDISLLEVAVVSVDDFKVDAIAHEEQLLADSMNWGLQYEVREGNLKDFNVLPLMMHILMQVPQLQACRGQIYTVLAELLSNALEHGVLGLDSELKHSANGFASYYQLRTDRLEKLTEGYVRIHLDYRQEQLTIEVEDSGKGFDHQRFLASGVDNGGYCGRGISLLKSICESVEYFGNGNNVRVKFIP